MSWKEICPIELNFSHVKKKILLTEAIKIEDI